MVNYQLGKIYKIIDLETNECYIGSTCQPTLARRLSKHVTNYKQYLKGEYGYTSSYEIIKIGNYQIILVEKYNCNNKDELRSRERYWIEHTVCVNKNKPMHTKLDSQLTSKKYKLNNASKVSAQKKIYNSVTTICECGGHYTAQNRGRHKRSNLHVQYIKDLVPDVVALP